MKDWLIWLFLSAFQIVLVKKGEHYQGMLISLLCILVFTARFFIEFLKENQVAFEATMKLNMGQLLSIPFILMGIGGLYWSLKKKKRAVIIG
jgi:phosphatidylglycerol:prolipoprotein diacylglycerol transferase